MFPTIGEAAAAAIKDVRPAQEVVGSNVPPPSIPGIPPSFPVRLERCTSCGFTTPFVSSSSGSQLQEGDSGGNVVVESGLQKDTCLSSLCRRVDERICWFVDKRIVLLVDWRETMGSANRRGWLWGSIPKQSTWRGFIARWVVLDSSRPEPFP